MKIIFLDIDGVLNSEDSIVETHEKEGPMFNDNPHKEHIKWLNYIIEKTDAKVVISSTWRKSSGISAIWRILDLLGFKGEIIGRTPDTGDIRGNEIKSWIERFENGRDYSFTINTKYSKKDFVIESFVILDDDSDMGYLKHRLVKTDSKSGLTQKEAELAVTLLNNNITDEVLKGYKILETIIGDLNKISSEKNLRTQETFRRKEDLDEIALALYLYSKQNRMVF